MNDKITDEQKNILYNSGTEMPCTSNLLDEKRSGTYVSAIRVCQFLDLRQNLSQVLDGQAFMMLIKNIL